MGSLRRPGIVLALLVLLLTARVSSAAAAPSLPRFDQSEPAQMLDLINADRASAGVAPVAWRADVAAIALVWSTQMSVTQTLAHNDLYFSAATKALIGSVANGENVAFSGSMEATNWEFMQSPGHRANILDPRFTAVGIAVVHDLAGTAWVTEDFLQERGAPASVAPPTAPAPEPIEQPVEQATDVVDAPEPAPAAAPVEPEPAVAAPTTTTEPTSIPATTVDPAIPAPAAVAASTQLGAITSAPEPVPAWFVALLAIGLVAVDLVALRVARALRTRTVPVS